MTDKVKTHYEVEDLPPDNADTKVELYEQAAETVKDGAVVAEQIRSDAEAVLGSIFQAADQAGDTTLANRVNDVWEQVQTLTTVAVRQGAALSGANGAIGALKEQRDKVLGELKAIKEAIENFDTGHEALSEFVEELEQSWEESSTDWWYDEAFDDAHESVSDSIKYALNRYAGLPDEQAEKLVKLLVYTPGNLTDEQKDLLKQIGATLREDVPETDEEESDE